MSATAEADPYRLFVESVRDYALILLDRTGNVVSWNPGASMILGYDAAEIVGRNFSSFYPAEERANKPRQELDQALALGRFEEEAWRVRRDGTRFWASVVVTPVKNARGEVTGFAKVTRDLTERRQAELERERHLRTIHLLGTPVMRIWPGILLLPIVGEVDDARSEQIMQTVLDRVVAENAKVMILDVSGLTLMSTHVADALLKTTAALRLVGARAILTGIGPRVSSTMVRLGVDVSAMLTHSQLDGGLALALSLIGRSVREA